MWVYVDGIRILIVHLWPLKVTLVLCNLISPSHGRKRLMERVQVYGDDRQPGSLWTWRGSITQSLYREQAIIFQSFSLLSKNQKIQDDKNDGHTAKAVHFVSISLISGELILPLCLLFLCSHGVSFPLLFLRNKVELCFESIHSLCVITVFTDNGHGLTLIMRWPNLQRRIWPEAKSVLRCNHFQNHSK